MKFKLILSFVLVFLSFNTNNVFAQICATAQDCAFAVPIDITNSTFSVIGSSQLDLSSDVNYVDMEGAAQPDNCGATYINGYDQLAGGTSILISLNTPIPVDPTVNPTVDYCFFFYNDSNLTGAEPVNYANPLNITLTTNAGNINATYPLTAADYTALEAGEWLFLCQTFTLQSGATEIQQIQQVLEIEASADGRCEVANGGYSVANTCEVFGIAPDGITTCPVEIVSCAADSGTWTN